MVAGADGSVAFLKVLETVECQIYSLSAVRSAQHPLFQADVLRSPDQIALLFILPSILAAKLDSVPSSLSYKGSRRKNDRQAA